LTRSEVGSFDKITLRCLSIQKFGFTVPEKEKHFPEFLEKR